MSSVRVSWNEFIRQRPALADCRPNGLVAIRKVPAGPYWRFFYGERADGNEVLLVDLADHKSPGEPPIPMATVDKIMRAAIEGLAPETTP